MTTRAGASLLLRRAWLLATALAVVAGLLGMHVLTSGHASHGAVPGGAVPGVALPGGAAAGHAVVAHCAGGGHSAHGGHHSTASNPDTPVFGSAGCCGSCPGAQEQGAPCVPSVPRGPVTLSPPQATLAIVELVPAADGPGYGYSYLPPSATPCELSISRT